MEGHKHVCSAFAAREFKGQLTKVLLERLGFHRLLEQIGLVQEQQGVRLGEVLVDDAPRLPERHQRLAQPVLVHVFVLGKIEAAGEAV